MRFFLLINLQLLSGPSGARSRDVTKRQRRKQRAQLEAQVPVKTEPPQVQVSTKIYIDKKDVKQFCVELNHFSKRPLTPPVCPFASCSHVSLASVPSRRSSPPCVKSSAEPEDLASSTCVELRRWCWGSRGPWCPTTFPG